MQRKIGPVLSDIMAAIDGIEQAIAGRHLAEFERDWLLKHGVQRGIEIISEASRRLPAEMKASRPEIPWRAIAGIGNVLRHGYDIIADEVVWRTAVDDLPPLKRAIQTLQADLHE